MRIEREQAIAVVVDYQEKLVPVMHEKDTLLRNSAILLEGLKILDVPLVITQQYTKGLGTSVETITNAAQTTEYIDKIAFTAYDSVKWKLRGKKFVIVCGIEAHICVLQTVIDLKEAGYVPVLVADCISSRKESDKQVALERARQEGAIVTTYESLLFELLKVAGTETSKKIQKLIK
jgi:nicotinamidase-related amidase